MSSWRRPGRERSGTERSSSCRRSRRTASGPEKWAPTPSDPTAILESLKAELAALDREPLAGASGIEVCRRRSDTFDKAVKALVPDALAGGVAVAATGGYGREEMTPGSDLDLLVLHGRTREEDVTAAVESLLYPLWDGGVRVSHAVRTVEECGSHAANDLAALTALLDGRLLAGSPRLVRAARGSAFAVARSDPEMFRRALDADRTGREERFGRLSRSGEGELKESMGGLRDVHALRWLEALRGRALAVRTPGLVREALDFLLLVRTALHRVSGGPSNRLSAEHQAAVADVLGIAGRDGWEPRDRLVRIVGGHARWVELIARGEPEGWSQVEAMAEDAGIGSRRHGARPAGPVALAERLRDSEVLVWTPSIRDRFVRLLEGSDPVAVLQAMDAVGLLQRLVPEWGQVSGRPQRDPYHRYPVDVHLATAAGAVARLLREPPEPFLAEAAASIDDRPALLLGALLHDVGKVGGGSHVRAGESIAAGILDRMGVEGEQHDLILFLVREHLLLSDTATRRNLEDEDLIIHVAARVGDERRLAALFLLTVADAEATGPSAASPWRMTLIRELVGKVSQLFTRGSMDRAQAERLRDAERRFRVSLEGAPSDQVEAFLESVPPAYLLAVQPSDARNHLGLVLPIPAGGEFRTHVRAGRSPGAFLLAISAFDRLGLLSDIAGALTLSGLSILTAQAFTTEQEVALDLFEVRSAFDEDVSKERWDRFETLLGQALREPADLRARVHELRAHYRPARSGIPVSVTLHPEASDYSTVVEVEAADRLGLLFDLTSALAEHRFDVHSARVATYGPRVVDVFYVTDSDGQRVGLPERLAELEDAMAEAAATR